MGGLVSQISQSESAAAFQTKIRSWCGTALREDVPQCQPCSFSI